MANTKDYAMREMILDRCFSTGKEYTREELMDIVNHELERRGMVPVRSRTTFTLDIQEMNEKFYRMYGSKGIVWEDKHRRRYYRYRTGVESIYNRELTQEEIERMQEICRLMQGFKGMPQYDWLDEIAARFDMAIQGRQQEIASFEGGTDRDVVWFMPLVNAISNHQVMTMNYQRFALDAKERIIHPYYLKQYRRRWYLYATIDGKESVVCFGLDRILTLLENHTVNFKDCPVDFRHYFDNIVGVSLPDDGVVEHVVIKGNCWVENYLTTSPLHPSQKIESLGKDGCRVTLDVIVNHELEQELLFYGEHLTVLEPVSLREKMQERIKKMFSNYELKE